MLEPNDLKKGVVFKYKNDPVVVLDFSHTHKGRGSAVVTAKIRNLITGSVQTLTFKAGEKLEEADITNVSANFLYRERKKVYFMNSENYEQIELEEDGIKEKLNFLREGEKVTVVEFEGNPIDIELSPKVDLKVTRSETGVRGDTASGTVHKLAVLETGYEISVPLFVKEGDIIRVNTETGKYVERVH